MRMPLAIHISIRNGGYIVVFPSQQGYMHYENVKNLDDALKAIKDLAKKTHSNLKDYSIVVDLNIGDE